MLDIHYICSVINQGECEEKTKIAYTDKLTKEIASKLRANYEYFHKFDNIIVYYDYGQTELAQILVSVFNTMFANVEFRKIETNQYKLSQAADLICTLELLKIKAESGQLSKSEERMFHSKRELKKDFLKGIGKKEF